MITKTPHPNRWKKVGLSLAIVIVLNLFVNTGIFTFYKQPQFDQFCSEIPLTKEITTAAECVALTGSEWTPYQTIAGESPEMTMPKTADGRIIEGWCDVQAECREQFESATNVYNRNVFIVLVVFGTIVLVIGLFITNLTAVANGLIYGGIISMFIGTVRYWSNMDDYLRFILMGIVLVILLWIGIRKLNDAKDKHEAVG